jgi:hypothetical protein
MKYLLVSVYDGYVKFNALHDRTSGDYTRAYGDLLDFFAERKKKVTVIKLDNEKSAEVEDMFRQRDTEYAYVPPGNHRTLKAERAIRAAKNHIIAMLCTADDEFPMYLWDKVLPQAELTIKHLRECKSNPAVSAYEGMFNKKYDFDAHPIAPVGIKVIVHDKPDNRASWDAHGVEGFYLGPALDHYRCWRAWIKSTRSVRVSDTMAWFPARVKMPGASPIDMLSAAVKDVSAALTRVADNEAVSQHRQPYDTLHVTAVSALQDIARMLNPNAPFANPPDDVAEPVIAMAPIQRVPVEEPPDVIAAPPVMELRRNRQPSRAWLEGQANLVTWAEIDNDQFVCDGEDDRQNSWIAGQCKHRGYVFQRVPLNHRHKSNNAATQRMNKFFSSNTAYSMLNLTDEGEPLNYRRAKSGPNTALWEIEEAVEIRKLMTTGTIRPIHLHEVPADRKMDATYYNPQVTEKFKNGKIKRRVVQSEEIASTILEKSQHALRRWRSSSYSLTQW